MGLVRSLGSDWSSLHSNFLKHFTRWNGKTTHIEQDRHSRLTLYSAVGYTFMVVVALHLLHVKVGSILVGGVLTGVIVGIGAQSTLSNFFAGMILFTLRPFSVGQTITVRTYLFSGVEYSGFVEDITWYHTILISDGQKRLIPNTSIIVSVITIVSNDHMRVIVIPLPYAASFHDFERKLNEETGDYVEVTVRDFAETFYNCEVKFPIHGDADAIRRVLHNYRHPTQADE